MTYLRTFLALALFLASAVAFTAEPLTCIQAYHARIIKVVDGDTVDAHVYLGMNTFIQDRIRLAGIDTPEIRGPSRVAGHAARDALVAILAEGEQMVVLQLQDKRDKYGRWIGTLFDKQNQSINQRLMDAGHAVEYIK